MQVVTGLQKRCHRCKNENIRAGALLNMKIWLVEVIYPQSNF